VDVKLKEADVLEDGFDGDEVIVVSGVAVSIVQVYDAGVASTFPTRSIALTWNVWLPVASPEYNCGVVHAVNPAPSSWHSNVPASVDVNVKDADVLEDGFDGDEVIVVSGDIPSEGVVAVPSLEAAVPVPIALIANTLYLYVLLGCKPESTYTRKILPVSETRVSKPVLVEFFLSIL